MDATGLGFFAGEVELVPATKEWLHPVRAGKLVQTSTIRAIRAELPDTGWLEGADKYLLDITGILPLTVAAIQLQISCSIAHTAKRPGLWNIEFGALARNELRMRDYGQGSPPLLSSEPGTCLHQSSPGTGGLAHILP